MYCKESGRKLWASWHDLDFSIYGVQTRMQGRWADQGYKPSRCFTAWGAFSRLANLYCRLDPPDGWSREMVVRLVRSAILGYSRPTLSDRTTKMYVDMVLAPGLFEPIPRGKAAGRIRLSPKRHNFAKRAGAHPTPIEPGSLMERLAKTLDSEGNAPGPAQAGQEDREPA